MDRALPAPRLDWRPLRWAVYGLVAIAAAANLVGVWGQLEYLLSPAGGLDYHVLAEAARDATPYETPPYGYVWSPLALPLLAVLTSGGLAGWAALHAAALLPLRDWRLIALTAASWPFWTDVAVGNVMVLVAVSAYLAVSGSRVWTAVFFVLALLMPRPLMLPALAWILWQRPATRLPFAALAVVNAAAVVATGCADEWLRAMLVLEHHVGAAWDVGPSRILGAWWAPVGILLGAWLTWRGRLGLASLAVMPYLFAQYLLMLLLELRRAQVPIRR